MKREEPFLAAAVGQERQDALMAEVLRLRDALDTIDWLLHVDRFHEPKGLTRGDTVKRNVVDLVRSTLGDEWFKARGIPL